MELIPTVRKASGNPLDLGLAGTLPRIPACTGRWKGLSYFARGFPWSTVVFLEDTDWFSHPSSSVFRSCLYQLRVVVLTVWLPLRDFRVTLVSHLLANFMVLWACNFAKYDCRHDHIPSSKHPSGAELMLFSVVYRWGDGYAQRRNNFLRPPDRWGIAEANRSWRNWMGNVLPLLFDTTKVKIQFTWSSNMYLVDFINDFRPLFCWVFQDQ